MAKPKERFQFRKAYDGREVEGSRYAVHFDADQDLTHQQFKEDADINVLMKRFGVTGKMPMPSMLPFYGDFSQVGDFHGSMQMVRQAQEAFALLPASVRAKFHNSPSELVQFLHSEMSPEQLKEARELGLVEPEKAPPAPQKVEVVNTAPPAAPPPVAPPGA